MAKKINIPTSMLKNMLSQNDCRVTPQAVAKFKTMLANWASEVSKKASDKVLASKRKTINAEDLE